MDEALTQFDENEMIFGRQLDKDTGKGTNTIVYVQKNKLNREGLVPLSDETEEDKPVTKQDNTDLEDSLVPLKVFRVEAEKYENACKKGDGVKKISEVGNYNFMVAMPQDKFSELPSIQMGKQSLTLDFSEDNGKKFVNGIKQVNNIGGQTDNLNSQSVQPGIDGTGNTGITQAEGDVVDYDTKISEIQGIKDEKDEKDKSKLTKLNEIITLFKPDHSNNVTDNDDVYDEIENILNSEETAPKTKYESIHSTLKNKLPDMFQGGKATRRRKRKGKKRSKNTRKKRKSKKARKSKR